MKPQGFPPECRLRTQAEFDRVFEEKVRAADARLLVFAARNGRAHARLGLIVSRRQGNSVVRHRLKRQLREAFRLSRDELPTGLDVVVIPQEPGPATVIEYQVSLKKLTAKLAKRLEKSPPK